MPKQKNIWLLIVLSGAIAAGQLPADAQSSGAPRHLMAARKSSSLKKLVPQEDLSLEPDPSDVFDQAVREYSAGHMPEAEKLFGKVLSLDPANADAHFNLGAIREWNNDNAGALAHYQAALRLKPGDSEFQDAINAVHYKIKNKSALDAQAQRNKQARDLELHGQMAKQAFAAQNYGEAIVHLNQLVKTMPDDPKIQFALGQSLRAMKYYEWAAYRLKLAIYLDPDNDLYRQTLVELDREVQDAQRQAFQESARMALQKVQPFSFPELAETGMKRQ